uniref:Ig-like domain-containing protein n=1 Tax=Streptomyces sp. DG1A-41 TaxID=3125779 RepID=UPI00404007D1
MFRAVPGLANTWEPHASINVFNASRAKHILQDTIYTSTVVGAAPKLPSSIRMLTTANNRITDVPVRWQPLPPGATDKPGEATVTGMTDKGPVTAVIDVVPRRGEHASTTS